MGNPKLAAMSLQKFDVMLAREIQALVQSVNNGDAKAAAATAHKIKGAAANVSAEGSKPIVSACLFDCADPGEVEGVL